MSRRAVEQQLIGIRFSKYTGEVGGLIGRVQRENAGCADTSDIVIDAIWAEFRDDFSSLNIKASNAHASDKASARHGMLTPSGREALRDYINRAREFEAELGDMEDDEFEALAQNSLREHEEQQQARRKARATDNDRWAFFNEPRATANFAHWRTASAWTPEEAVALSLGKSPAIVNPDTLQPYNRIASASLFREEFARRLDLLERALKVGELPNPVPRARFLKWAAERGLHTPPEFSEAAPPAR
jgi:hypothetical protein